MSRKDVYFLNYDLGVKNTGVEVSSILRSYLFLFELNILPVFITLKYKSHLATEIYELKNNNKILSCLKVVNIYDFFQGLNSVENFRVKEFLYFENGTIKVPLRSKENNKYFNDNGGLCLYAIYNSINSSIHYINHFDKGVKWRRDYYHESGFLSCVQILNRKSQKVEEELYYRMDGTISIIKNYFFNDNEKLLNVSFQIIDSNGNLVCLLNGDNDFIYYFLSLYFNKKEGDQILLVDKNRFFYEPSIKLKKETSNESRKVYVIAAIHNLHVLNYKEKNTCRLNYNYSAIFRDLTAPDAVIVQTKLQQKDILERFEKGRVYAIPHTYENKLSESFHVKRKYNKAVYFARYSSEKRHDLAIDAFSKVVKLIPSAEFYCYGFGTKLIELKKKVAKLNLEDNIFLHGWCDNTAEEYESAGLSIVSSQSESFSLTVAESLAHGCPVVCFDVPYGPRELVLSGNNGYLVPYLDTQSMADEIIKIMSDPAHQKELSENARTSAERYSESVVAKQWKLVFSDLDIF